MCISKERALVLLLAVITALVTAKKPVCPHHAQTQLSASNLTGHYWLVWVNRPRHANMDSTKSMSLNFEPAADGDTSFKIGVEFNRRMRGTFGLCLTNSTFELKGNVLQSTENEKVTITLLAQQDQFFAVLRHHVSKKGAEFKSLEIMVNQENAEGFDFENLPSDFIEKLEYLCGEAAGKVTYYNYKFTPKGMSC